MLFQVNEASSQLRSKTFALWLFIWRLCMAGVYQILRGCHRFKDRNTTNHALNNAWCCLTVHLQRYDAT